MSDADWRWLLMGVENVNDDSWLTNIHDGDSWLLMMISHGNHGKDPGLVPWDRASLLAQFAGCLADKTWLVARSCGIFVVCWLGDPGYVHMWHVNNIMISHAYLCTRHGYIDDTCARYMFYQGFWRLAAATWLPGVFYVDEAKQRKEEPPKDPPGTVRLGILNRGSPCAVMFPKQMSGAFSSHRGPSK